MRDPYAQISGSTALSQRGHGSGHGTWSVCPVCLAAIPAQRCGLGRDVVLRKECPEHGAFETVIWRGKRPSYGEWRKAKTPSRPPHLHTGETGRCPHACGLCPDHEQHTCTALLEITMRCNLRCPVCFAGAGKEAGPDMSLEAISDMYDMVRDTTDGCNIQLSGGEPTVREDLPAIIAMGRNKGFSFVQLNTNGLNLARDKAYAASLREAGLSSVFLQFDGMEDATYEALRGRPLAGIKIRAVEHCLEAGLGVVLVPTVAPSINDGQLGEVLRFALEAGSGVRGVHFQPISYFGRHPLLTDDRQRITLPEIIRSLEEQTDGLVRVEDFSPPGCEHALCSFHGTFLRTGDGGLKAMGGKGIGCCSPSSGQRDDVSGSGGMIPSAEEGARRSIAFTARQWDGPSSCECGKPGQGDGLDLFLDQVRTWSFSISGMAFQDAWNLDLERLKGCCIHVATQDGRLVPFCAWNLTAADGTPLYRKQGEDG